MVKKLTTILSVIILLVLGLIYGSPIEFMKQPEHRIASLTVGIIIGLFFFIVITQSFKLSSKFIKLVCLIIIAMIAIPYLWIGIWTAPTLLSKNYPTWQDIVIYKNKNEELIVKQFQEVSGSIHAYQYRKVIRDFHNGIRLSYIYNNKRMNGIWKVHNLEFENSFFKKRDSIFTATFKNGKIINY